MPEWLPDALKWVFGGGAAAAVGGAIALRVSNAKAASEVKVRKVFDSGLDYNQEQMRKIIEDKDETIKSLRADMSLRNLEIIDMHKKQYELVQQLADLQGQMRAETKLRARTAIRMAAERPAMNGVEVEELERDTGFGLPDDIQ